MENLGDSDHDLWSDVHFLASCSADSASDRSHRMALLVEVDHAVAKRLYERLGFCTDYTKRIAGQEYFHMVRGL